MEHTSSGSGAKDKMRGNWMQFKGKLREKWGDLTDDELDRMQGRREQIVGRIVERHGEDKSRVERDVDTISRETNYQFENR